MKKRSFQPFRSEELATFCEQMSIMLKAGISAAEAIMTIKEEIKDETLKKAFDQITDEMQIGFSLYDAFDHAGVFPPYFLHMTAVGERAGQLDEVFTSLASYYDRQAALSRSVKNAVTYPCIMIGMMLAVILVLVIKVMPIFSQVYSQLGTQMNGMSRAIMNAGTWLSRYSLVFLILAAVIAVAIWYLCAVPSGRKTLSAMGNKFSFSKRLKETTALSRFADGMAMTLKSGLDTDESLDLSAQLTDYAPLREKIRLCRQKTAEGSDFSTAFKESGIFSGLQARMVSVGIYSGSLETVMERAAGQYAQEAEDQLSRTVARLEPTLVAIMSVLVGMILLSVMLPLIGIMAGIG